MTPFVRIQVSICGKFVRVTVLDREILLTMAEWSQILAHPGEFAVVKAK